MNKSSLLYTFLLLGWGWITALHAQVPMALLSFQEKGKQVEGEGGKVSELLFAHLSMNPKLYLVEREELRKAMEEQELNLSGMVAPGEAVHLGRITGAKLLVTGSVIEAGKSKFLIAKIIGTETTRVLGASVKGPLHSSTADLTEELAEKIGATVLERSGDLLPKELTLEDRIASIKQANEGKQLPVISIDIQEEHVGRASIDPAAETEFQHMALKTGFTVVEPGDGDKDVVRLVGEGFSEFAYRKGNLISVKARLEVKALDREGNILAVDRQTRVAVDLAEQMAAKKALQDAAADLAERMLIEITQ